MRILIVPDKFKGSLTSLEVIDLVSAALQRRSSKLDIEGVAIGDGGEGSLRALRSDMDLQSVELIVSDPLFRPISAYYYRAGSTAYIEMSVASGIQLLHCEERDGMRTTTYGTGQLIGDAIVNGCDHIYLFAGGSATTDMGIGMATALGYEFYDRRGRAVLPVGGQLNRITEMRKFSMVDLSNITVEVVCDVDNPLYGHHGAAYVYGKQKGVSDQDLLRLDNGLRHFSEIIVRKLGVDIAHIPGAGAAGGLGGGAMAFLNAQMISGTRFFIDHLDIEYKISQADMVITGEGKIDRQTLHGKVIDGIYKLCLKHGKRLVILTGVNQLPDRKDLEIYDIMSRAIDEEDAIKGAPMYIQQIISQLNISPER